jgi:hypothetical protein
MMRLLLPTIVLASVLPLGSASAQVVRGELIDRFSQQPVARGFIVLIDTVGNELARGRIDRDGAFRMVAPGPGVYKLKTQIIGIQSTESDQFELATAQVLEYRFEIAASLVVLPAIVVEDVRTCHTSTEDGLAATTLWEEARKALGAVAWTEGEALLRHKRVRYERELHPRTLQLQDERRTTSSELSRGSPFHTADAESLVDEGYIQRTDDDEYFYYGPDASVLLTEEFARLHCFWPKPGLPDAPLVGLAFEPVMGRDVVDIQGTLWIDKHTYELRYLEFNYTELPVSIERGRIGGRVEFERLPEGPWIVSRWRIRMPVVSYRQPKPVADPDYWTPHELVSIREVGGWVDEVYTRSGAPVPRVTGATIVGRVIEQDTYRPIRGVPVVLLGTVLQVPTGETGRYRIDDVPEGDYYVTLGDMFLDSLGYVPPPVPLRVRGQYSFEVDVGVVPGREAWSAVCPNPDEPEPMRGIVTGLVRDASTMTPVRDVRVAITEGDSTAAPRLATSGATIRWQTTTNDAGYYRVCGVPGDVPLTAAVTVEGRAPELTTVSVAPGGVIRLDFTFDRNRR